MPAWLIPALIGGATATVGAALTRRDAKKEAARVAEANKKEAARVQAENKAEAARVEALRKSEQYEAIQENTQVRENYYKNVVSDAQAAGINPLTALRTGAGASYGTAVAGTIRTPVMRDGVYLEGVYQTPTLSRNPIAAGLEAATNIGLSELTRQKQYSHESRMDELNKSLLRAQIKGMNAELSRNIDYSGYNQGDGVPVKFGLQSFTVPLEIAKRMRIAPNDYVEAGVIQELFGEVSEIFTAFAIEGYKDMYDMTPYGLLGSRDDKVNRHARKAQGLRGDRKRNRGKPSIGLTGRWLESVASALN